VKVSRSWPWRWCAGKCFLRGVSDERSHCIPSIMPTKHMSTKRQRQETAEGMPPHMVVLPSKGARRVTARRRQEKK
jgi:hypothetical protein